MTTKRFCDRCMKEIKFADEDDVFSIFSDNSELLYELCPACAKSFDKWFEEKGATA